jgi:sugar lactone lactonase YvrE
LSRLNPIRSLLKISRPRSFPRKACPELAEGRESSFFHTDVDPRLRGGDDNDDFHPPRVGRRPMNALPRKLLRVGAVFCFVAVLLGRLMVADSPKSAINPIALGAVDWVGELRSAADVKGKPSWAKRFLKAVIGLDDQQKAMLAPNGVCVDPQGRILVADTKERVLHVFDPARRRYQEFHPPDSDPFLAPIGVACDAQGRIYVSDALRARVFLFNPQGKYLRALGAVDREESIFKRATGIAVNSQSDRLYVVDTMAMRVVMMTLEGRVVGRFGQRGTGPGEFNYPTYVAVAPDGSLWVTDSLNFRVQHFDPEGKFLSAFGSPGSGPGDFDKAKGIAVDQQGRVYVVEGRNDRVQVYDAEGRLLFVFGSTGAGSGEFFLPTAITLDSENRIYVAVGFNRRVQMFRLRPDGFTPRGGQ